MTKLPNVLLCISDQQRTDTLGFLGRTPCRTPHIDRLAREGTCFVDAICPSPICLPSRASMMTGQYPHQVNMMSNKDTIAAPPRLTDALRGAGYHTSYAGKWHLEPDGHPAAFKGREAELGLLDVHGPADAVLEKRRIDAWFDRAEGQASADYSAWCAAQGLPDGWPVSDDDLRTKRTPSMTMPTPKRQADLTADQTYDGWVTSLALNFLEERPADRPFFLVCGWFAPHPPFKVPDPFFDMYGADLAPEPHNFGLQGGEPAGVARSFYHALFEDYGDRWPPWAGSMAAYWGYTSMVDAQFGRLLARLEAEGVLDDTLVIYCSDHGEMMGSHGLWHKMAPYEECLRVPLILRLPGSIAAGQQVSGSASLIDVPATILAACGLPIPDVYEGADLLSGDRPCYRFSEMRSLGDWHGIADFRLVVDDRFKRVWNRGERGEFYDLASDPCEQTNRIDDPTAAPDIDRLTTALIDWMRKTSDPLLAAAETELLSRK
ncbi:MAG: sulfatase-like hydrolase/transferase [Pseudomonadota bacterium]